MSPVENMPSTSRVKYAGAENNMDQSIQLPGSAIERNNKKRKLEEDDPGYTDALISKVFLEKMTILQGLREKEKKLKIAIEYEKLRREQNIFLDTDVLQKKIAECQRIIKELKSKLKMQNVMCSNLQLANTLQRIVGKPKAVHKTNGFSEIQRIRIKLLLTVKKDLMRKIGNQRKQLAEIDETILKYEKHYSANQQIGSEPVADCGSSNTSTNADKLKQLQRMKEDNEKTAKRIHLLSGIIQNLSIHIGKRCRKDPEIANLMAECKKVSECQFHDVNEINELLKSVGSLNL